MHHRLHFHELLDGDVTEDSVAGDVLLPGGLLLLADGAAVGQHLFAARAAGVEVATRGRVEGAGDVTAQADLLLIGRRVGDGHGR